MMMQKERTKQRWERLTKYGQNLETYNQAGFHHFTTLRGGSKIKLVKNKGIIPLYSKFLRLRTISETNGVNTDTSFSQKDST